MLVLLIFSYRMKKNRWIVLIFLNTLANLRLISKLLDFEKVRFDPNADPDTPMQSQKVFVSLTGFNCFALGVGLLT